MYGGSTSRGDLTIRPARICRFAAISRPLAASHINLASIRSSCSTAERLAERDRLRVFLTSKANLLGLKVDRISLADLEAERTP